MPKITIEGEIPTDLDDFATYQAYNCLDSAITAQLLPVMLEQLNPNTATVYRREMRMQSLCLEMSTKGLPVDQLSLASILYDLEKDCKRAKHILDRFCVDGLGIAPVNPRSPVDVARLFYEVMRIPAITEYDRKTGARKTSTDIKALEKIREQYPTARPFVNAILAFREAAKMASVFNRGLEPGTGHLRGNFSPSGTESGRLSSQQNPYGRGTNLQNITNRLRQVVCAPAGYCIVNYDLKTAESLGVGYCSGSHSYINACLTGDVHTAVSKQTWRDLPWTGDLKADKAIAESPYYRMFSYRDMAKRGGHLSNYYGTPPTMAMHLKVPRKVCEEFQDLYFQEFPEIKEWQLEVIRKVQQDQKLITRLGRERQFWGRPDDPATWREAIAYEPQSLIADAWNEGLMAVQAWLMKECPDARVLRGSVDGLCPLAADLRAQVHDSGVFIIPLDAVIELAPAISDRLLYPVDFGSLGSMVIPNDIMIGKRWNKRPKRPTSAYDSYGLVDWKPGEPLPAWLVQ